VEHRGLCLAPSHDHMQSLEISHWTPLAKTPSAPRFSWVNHLGLRQLQSPPASSRFLFSQTGFPPPSHRTRTSLTTGILMALSHSLARHLWPLPNPMRIPSFITAGNSAFGTQTSRRTAPIAPIALALQFRHQSGPPQPPPAGGASDYQYGPANDVQPQPHTQHKGNEGDHGSSQERAPGKAGEGGGGSSGSGGTYSKPANTAWKMFESAATTAASLSILGYGLLGIEGHGDTDTAP